MSNADTAEGSRVDLLLARIPEEWTPEIDVPWCPRASALTRLRREDQVRSLAADNLLSRLAHKWGALGHHYLSTGQPVPDDCSFGLSASHDADVVLVGAARGRVGVDVVACHRKVDWVERMLGEDERDVLSSCGAAERSLVLSTAWAVREASLKYLGTGLLVNPRVLSVSLTDKKSHWSFAQEVPCQFGDRLWEVRHDDHLIEVATAGSVDGSYTFAVAFSDLRMTICLDNVSLW